jgi:hypothetical protein
MARIKTIPDGGDKPITLAEAFLHLANLARVFRGRADPDAAIIWATAEKHLTAQAAQEDPQ